MRAGYQLLLSTEMMSSRVGERRVPPWMTVIARALRSATAPVTEAPLSISKVLLAELTETIRALSGIPVPVTGMPTSKPVVLVTPIVVESRVAVAPETAVRLAPAPRACRMPPEMTRRTPPSGTLNKEEPGARRRTVIGATTFCRKPA